MYTKQDIFNALACTTDLSYVACQIGEANTYIDNAIDGANTYTDISLKMKANCNKLY